VTKIHRNEFNQIRTISTPLELRYWLKSSHATRCDKAEVAELNSLAASCLSLLL
jgi:hypothetical protein